jgi:hypothetical protein
MKTLVKVILWVLTAALGGALIADQVNETVEDR